MSRVRRHADNGARLKLPACSGAVAQKDRLAAVLGREFGETAVPIEAQREGRHLTGLIGLPTYHRATTTSQYLFVNGRAVRDRLLLGALKGGYEDMIIGWEVDEREGEGSIRVPVYPVRTLIFVFALVSAFTYLVLLVHFLFGGQAITEEEEGKYEPVSGSQI